MNDYQISQVALQEIEDILDYVADADIEAADRVRDGIFGGLQQLANRPGLGHRRPDLTKLPLRFRMVMRRYLVAYRADGPSIEIVRVFGPGRDVAKLLRQPPSRRSSR